MFRFEQIRPAAFVVPEPHVGLVGGDANSNTQLPPLFGVREAGDSFESMVEASESLAASTTLEDSESPAG
jgi:hypothetical protein